MYEGTGHTNVNTSSAAPDKNKQATAYLQNAPRPQPAYNVQPATQVLNVPPVVPQWSPAAAIVPQNTDSSYAFYRTFLKVKPKALGIVLIVAGVLQFALGVGLQFTMSAVPLISSIPFWGSIYDIIAGALTIAAQCKPNICLVKGSLSLNIISSVFSFIALVLNCIDLATIGRSVYYGSNYNNNDYNDIYYNYNNYYYNYFGNYNYYYRYQQLLPTAIGLHSILIVINLLLFSVSLSVSIFGCCSLSRVAPNAPQVFVIQNDAVVSTKPSTDQATFD